MKSHPNITKIVSGIKSTVNRLSIITFEQTVNYFHNYTYTGRTSPLHNHSMTILWLFYGYSHERVVLRVQSFVAEFTWMLAILVETLRKEA